ncbi:MAG TPA: hypothetical protein VHT95_11000, partial [Vicinamibacterales bacterium]|nr:hypothetical protein [Vicinamibacterales bacterium]
MERERSFARPGSGNRAKCVAEREYSVGTNYGNQNLSQLDLRASKRIKLDKFRFRVDVDAYNIFNSD